MVLKRFVHGADGAAFFQKRAVLPAGLDADDHAELPVGTDRRGDGGQRRRPAGLGDQSWAASTSTRIRSGSGTLIIPMRTSGVDLDPVPGVEWEQIVRVALVARTVLSDFGLVGFGPRLSGSRGIHIYSRIEPRWTFPGTPPGGRGPGQGNRRGGRAG